MGESAVSDRAADIDVYYGERARTYDEVRMKKSKWFDENDALDRLIAPFPRSRIVDIPVGTGRYVASYQRYDNYVCGCDVSHDMLAEADKKFAAAGIKYDLQIRSILDPLPKTFDIAVCTRLFNHFTLDECRLAMKNMIDACQYVIIGLLEPPPPNYRTVVKWPNRHKLSDVTEGLLVQKEEQIVIDNKSMKDYHYTRLRRVD